MKLDPILAEIRQIRDEMAEKYAGDFSAMVADLKKRQAASGRPIYSPPPPTEPPREETSK